MKKEKNNFNTYYNDRNTWLIMDEDGNIVDSCRIRASVLERIRFYESIYLKKFIGVRNPKKKSVRSKGNKDVVIELP